jgi:hypothetical protein
MVFSSFGNDKAPTLNFGGAYDRFPCYDDSCIDKTQSEVVVVAKAFCHTRKRGRPVQLTSLAITPRGRRPIHS